MINFHSQTSQVHQPGVPAGDLCESRCLPDHYQPGVAADVTAQGRPILREPRRPPAGVWGIHRVCPHGWLLLPHPAGAGVHRVRRHDTENTRGECVLCVWFPHVRSNLAGHDHFTLTLVLRGLPDVARNKEDWFCFELLKKFLNQVGLALNVTIFLSLDVRWVEAHRVHHVHDVH